jgi:hypothetical protein
VPLVSESVWANAGTAAVQSTISADQTFTSDPIARPASAVRINLLYRLRTYKSYFLTRLMSL